jgi:peptidyl-prolyl cis-trans isomerase SurA
MKRLGVMVCLLAAPLAWAQEKGKVVEEIVARVNNEVITRSELERAQASVAGDARQDCPKCTPEQLQNIVADREKNMLRDLIDQSLLVQKAKDLGLTADTDVVKRLDAIRLENKLPDMEALEKAVAAQGLSWEDFRSRIRNTLLTQKVVSQEVGRTLDISHSDVEKYYNEHKSDFVRPEQVVLREIFVSTEGKKESEIPDLEKKAKGLRERVVDGEDFAQLATHFSEGSTAKDGGYLGTFKRGELAKEIEDVVFGLKKHGMTDVIRTKQGFLVLMVVEHYDEGQQTLENVESEIMDKLYGQKMDPAYRKYLSTLRDESYVIIKPGYVDTGGAAGTQIQEVSATPEESKAKQGHKRFLLFGKKKAAGV